MTKGSGSITPPEGKCRQCNSPLVRDQGRKLRWHCSNLACTSHQKSGHFIGNVRVLGK